MTEAISFRQAADFGLKKQMKIIAPLLYPYSGRTVDGHDVYADIIGGQAITGAWKIQFHRQSALTMRSVPLTEEPIRPTMPVSAMLAYAES